MNVRIDALTLRLADLETRLIALSATQGSDGASDPQLRHRVRELERSAGSFKLKGDATLVEMRRARDKLQRALNLSKMTG